MSDLPFDTDEEEAKPEPETLASNVLVVDDEPVVRDVFQRLLAREQDMVVSVAEDAEQGLELIKKQRFELLITDKNLPGMGGIELIAEARAVRPNIEAVMITGYASSESLISAFAAGASDYLVKPFDDLKVVRAKVRAALQRRLDRRQSQISSKDMARQAAALLGQGKDAPEAVWRKLDTKFAEYEHAIRDGAGGTVIVVGTERTVEMLGKGGVQAQRVEPESPEVMAADVVVIETGPKMDWHPLAEKLMPLPPDVVLVAGPESDLSDLLEAISLRVDLVGFGGHAPPRLLPDRVRANLMRRSVERAQKELALALHEFKQSLRERQESPPAETAGISPVAVSPPLAALAAVPLVNRPGAPVAVPQPRSPVTPQIPMPASIARPPAAASPVARSPVTPSAPLPATSALGSSELETPGPAAPKHKPAAPGRSSTPVPGVPRPVEAGGPARPAAPPNASPGAALRRPTGSHPQIAPPPEDPSAAPGGARRPTGWHSMVPPEQAPGASGAGTPPVDPSRWPTQEGAPRHISGSFPQAAPPTGAAATPRRQTPGASPQVAPADTSATRRPTPVPLITPVDTPADASATRRPTSLPLITPVDVPADVSATRRPVPLITPVDAPADASATRRPTPVPLIMPVDTPADVSATRRPIPLPLITPVDTPADVSATKRPTPPLFTSPDAPADASATKQPAPLPLITPVDAPADPFATPAPLPLMTPMDAPADAPVTKRPSPLPLITPVDASATGGAMRRPSGPHAAMPHDAAGAPAPAIAGAPSGGASPQDGTGAAMRRPSGSFPQITPAAPLPATTPPQDAPLEWTSDPSEAVTPMPGGPAPGSGAPPQDGAMRRPSGSFPQLTPAAPPAQAPHDIPLEWTSTAPEAPAAEAASVPLITASEAELSLDQAFAEWDAPEQKAAPPPPPPPAPVRRNTGSFPQAAPQDNAARRKAASPFPIMSVAQAESALKAAQAQAAQSTPASAKPPQPPAPPGAPRRSTGSFPQQPSPASPAPPTPPGAPRTPLQGIPAIRNLPPTQTKPATELSDAGAPSPDKPKPPNGGSR
jgi:CheY-like chemotaxis protein